MAYIRSNKRDTTLDKLIDRSITEITSNITTIGDYALYNCSQLTSANFPFATNVGNYAFNSCRNLTTVNLPLLTTISGNYAFGYCEALTTFDAPNLSSTGSGAFYNSGFVSVSFPSLITVGTSCFSQSPHLSFVSIASASISAPITIDWYVFIRCSNFKTLVLRSTSMAILAHTNSFTGTAFDTNGSGGKLYVPQTLISTYQNDTMWQQILSKNANNQILAIEGSPYE